MTDSGILGIGTMTLLSMALGYFVYGIPGVFAMLILSIVFGLVAVSGLIPVLGQVLYFIICPTVLSWTLTLAGLEPTWLTNVVFWWYFAGSCFFSFIIIACAVLGVRR